MIEALVNAVNAVGTGNASEVNELVPSCEQLLIAVQCAKKSMSLLSKEEPSVLQLMSRDLSMSLAQLVIGKPVWGEGGGG